MTDRIAIVHHRADFLEIRRRYIHEMVSDGESFDEIARALSTDPGQVQLISMTDTALPCRVTDLLDSALPSPPDLVERVKAAVVGKVLELSGGKDEWGPKTADRVARAAIAAMTGADLLALVADDRVALQAAHPGQAVGLAREIREVALSGCTLDDLTTIAETARQLVAILDPRSASKGPT